MANRGSFQPGTSGNPKGPQFKPQTKREIWWHIAYWNTKQRVVDLHKALKQDYGERYGILAQLWGFPPIRDDRITQIEILNAALDRAEKTLGRYIRKSRKNYFRARYVGERARRIYPKANHSVLLTKLLTKGENHD